MHNGKGKREIISGIIMIKKSVKEQAPYFGKGKFFKKDRENITPDI
jgi:hypothetical protein